MMIHSMMEFNIKADFDTEDGFVLEVVLDGVPYEYKFSSYPELVEFLGLLERQQFFRQLREQARLAQEQAEEEHDEEEDQIEKAGGLFNLFWREELDRLYGLVWKPGPGPLM